MADNDREKLARVQREALGAVLRKGDLPAGFDAAQVVNTAKVLVGKRRREAALAMPQVVEALGEQFVPLFDTYAEVQGYPTRGGPLEDAAGFAWHLRKLGKLPQAAHWGVVMMRGRQGFPVKLCWMWRSLYLTIRRGSRVRGVADFCDCVACGRLLK